MSHTSSDRWRDRERGDVQRERERQARERAQLVEGQHDNPSQPIFGEPIKVDPKREDEMARRVKSTLGDYQKVQKYLIEDQKHLIGISRCPGYAVPQRGVSSAVINNSMGNQQQPRPPESGGVAKSADNNSSGYPKPVIANGQHKSLICSSSHPPSDHYNSAVLKQGNNWSNSLQAKPPATAQTQASHPLSSSLSSSSSNNHCKNTEQDPKLVQPVSISSSSLGGVQQRHGKQSDRTTCTVVPPTHQKSGSSGSRNRNQLLSHKMTADSGAKSRSYGGGAQCYPPSSVDKNKSAAVLPKSSATKLALVAPSDPGENNNEYLQNILKEMTSLPSPISAIVTPEQEDTKDDSPISPLESATSIVNSKKHSQAESSTSLGRPVKQENTDEQILSHKLSDSESDDDDDADHFVDKSSASLPEDIKSAHNEIFQPPSPVEGLSSSSDSSSSGSEDSSSASDSEDSDSSRSSIAFPPEQSEQTTKGENWSLINFVEKKNASSSALVPHNNNSVLRGTSDCAADYLKSKSTPDSSKLPYTSLADEDSVNYILRSYPSGIKEYLSPTSGSLDFDTGGVDVPCETQPPLSPLRSPCVQPPASPCSQNVEAAKMCPDSEWSFCAADKVGSCQLQRDGVLKIRLAKMGNKSSRNSTRSTQGDPCSTPSGSYRSNNGEDACKTSNSKGVTEDIDGIVMPSSPIAPPTTPPVVFLPTSDSVMPSSKVTGETGVKPKKHVSTHRPKERDKSSKEAGSESKERSSSSQKRNLGSSSRSKEGSQKSCNASTPQHSSTKSKASSKRSQGSSGGTAHGKKNTRTKVPKSKEIISTASSSSDSESQDCPTVSSLKKLTEPDSHKEQKSPCPKTNCYPCDNKSTTHSTLKSPKKARMTHSKERHSSEERSRSLCSITEVINRVASGDGELDLPKYNGITSQSEHANDVPIHAFTKSSPVEPPELLSPIPNGFTPTHQQQNDYKGIIQSLPVQIKLSLLERVPRGPSSIREPIVPSEHKSLEVRCSSLQLTDKQLQECKNACVKLEKIEDTVHTIPQKHERKESLHKDAKSVSSENKEAPSRTLSEKPSDPTNKTKTSSKRKAEESLRMSEKKFKSSTKSGSHRSQEKSKSSNKKVQEAENAQVENKSKAKSSSSSMLARCDSASSICSFSSQKSQSRSTQEKESSSTEGGTKTKHPEQSPVPDKTKRSATPSSEKDAKRKEKDEAKKLLREKKDSSKERSKDKSASSSTRDTAGTKDAPTKAPKKQKTEVANSETTHTPSSQITVSTEEPPAKVEKSTKSSSSNNCSREGGVSVDNQALSSQPETKKSQNHVKAEPSSSRSYMTPSDLSTMLYSTEETLREAKSLKREADKEEDKTLQVIKYVKAVLYFTLTGMRMEQSNTDVNKTYQMFKETNNLIRHITSKFLKIQNFSSSSYVDNKLAVLSLRCQALLYRGMHSLRKAETKECRKAFADFQRSPASRAILQPSPVPPATLQTPSAFRLSHTSPCQPRTGSSGGTSGVPSPHSPTPSPAGSVTSVGSQSSGYSSSELGAIPTRSSGGSAGGSGATQSFLFGGGHGAPPGSLASFSSHAPVQQSQQLQQQQPGTVALSEHIYNLMQRLINLQSNLQMCFELWEQADTLTNRSHSKEFFRELEDECGHLSMESSFTQLFQYVYTGLVRLERIYTST